MRALLASVATLALALLSGPAAADAPPPPLRETLTARAGAQQVYLTYGEDGVVASPADGSWSVTVAPGPVLAAAYDPAMELLWIIRGANLEVVDLRERAPQPVVIVSRWNAPTESYGSSTHIEVRGLSRAATDTTYAGVYPTLTWAAKPKIGSAEGAYGGIWEDQDKAQKKAIRKAKIVGGAWLTAQLGRQPRKLKVELKQGSERPKVKLPDGMGECEDEELCGDAREFGPTGYAIVVVSHACGDACHVSCLLFDPATRKFASPETPATWGATAEPGGCNGYTFDGSGTTWIADDKVCSKAGCKAIKTGHAFDWIDGGRVHL